MSDLDRFEAFAQVAQLGSITKAAQVLSVSKAALSKQIKQLEHSYQVELFARSKQRLLLTTQGEVLLKQCLRLKNELDTARDICKTFNAEPSGKLHVVAFGYFAERLIFPKLKDFLKKYPKIQLQIDTTEQVPNFIKEQIDLAVGFSLPVPNEGEVIQKRMATTRYILCGSRRYFQEYGTPKTLEDLQQHQYIDHVSRAMTQTLKLKKGYDITIKPFLLLNSVTAMIECAKRDLGLIQLPLYMVEPLLKSGELIEVLTEFQAINTSVYYHYPKLRYMQSKVRKFINYFIKNSAPSDRVFYPL